MKRLLFIVGLVISCCVSAKTLTATIEAWNSASLIGDVTPAMEVSFTNSSHSSNRVGAGHQAVLTLTNLPKATITAITLNMHSNSTGGGAKVTLKVDKTTIQVADGLFRDWKGVSEFTTIDQPIKALTRPVEISEASTLTLTIDGSANSVYLTSMVVTYTPVPREPATLTLHYLNADLQAVSQTLKEDTVDSGWLLPFPNKADYALSFGDTTWQWLGWCEAPVALTNEQPNYYEGGQTYTKGKDADLYALYTNCGMQFVDQTTELVSGEYILVQVIGEEAYAIHGDWTDQQLSMRVVTLVYDTICSSLLCYAPSDEQRYELTVSNDSVTIRNVATRQWIGYNNLSVSSTQKAWKWQQGCQNTFFFQSTVNKLSLVYDWDITNAYYYGAAINTTYNDHELYWMLFSTDQLPRTDEQRYTTCPVYAGIEAPTMTPIVRKTMDTQGHIRIINSQYTYDLVGRRL